MNILGKISDTWEQVVQQLTREDCLEMVRTKRCDKRELLACQGDFCTSEFIPETKYLYLQTTKYEWNYCEVYSETIEAENSYSVILNNQYKITSCLASELYCKFKESILVWSEDIINECPFAVVKSIGLENINGILVNDKENKLFQVTGNKTICNNIQSLITAEGFYLTTDIKALKLRKDFDEIKVIDGLILSEMDFQKRNLLSLVTSLFKNTNEKLCQLYKSFINLYSKLDDEFFTFNDYNGNEAVLYSDEGRILIPQCVEINEIDVIEETKKCYKDYPI